MYYRVALQVAASPPWQWKSTALSSLTLVIGWLQFYRVLPRERLRIFAAGSPEALNEQLLRENQGLPSSSVPALQFLHERGLAPPGRRRETAAAPTRTREGTASVVAVTKPAPGESRSSPLDQRREQFEGGAGGDHDLPYRCTLPTALPHVLDWVQLRVRVQQGILQP